MTADIARPGRGSVGLRWLGQAGFVISAGGVRVLVDPWLASHPARATPAPSIGLIPADTRWLLATHEHGDHLDLASLPGLVARLPNLGVVVPEPLRAQVSETVPGISVSGVQPGDKLNLGGMALSVVRAWHGVAVEDGYTDGYGLRSDALTPHVGYVLAFPGVTVYHGGDTILTDELVAELMPHGVDVALLPVNGRDAAREARGIVGNLNPSEAVTLASAVGARVLVPMHFDMVRGNRLSVARVVDAARRSSAALAVLVPAPGVDIELGA